MSDLIDPPFLVADISRCKQPADDEETIATEGIHLVDRQRAGHPEMIPVSPPYAAGRRCQNRNVCVRSLNGSAMSMRETARGPNGRGSNAWLAGHAAGST